MAIVRGFIIGTGQEIQVELQTARIPELPPFTDVQDDDAIAGWDRSENETRYLTLEMLRSKIIGDGTTQPPVLTNGTIQLVVDATHAGQYRWDLPAIAGQDFILQRRMVGDLLGGETMPEYEIISTGGFLLVGDAPKMREGEVFILKLVKLQGGDAEIIENSGGLFTGIVLIDSSLAYSELHERKVLHIAGGSNKIVYTLPSIVNVKDSAIIPFETNGINSVQTTIQSVDNQMIYFNGGASNTIWMGSGEILWLQKGEDGWYVISMYGNFQTVGEVEFGYKKKKNSLELNGELVLRADYPRLWNEVAGFGNSIVTDALWNPSNANDLSYKGCFSFGTNSTNFRLPDVRGFFVRFTDEDGTGRDSNERIWPHAGGYQGDSIKSFQLTVPKAKLSTTDAGSGDLKLTTGGDSSPGSDFTIDYTGSGETKPKNIYLTGYVKA